MSKERESTLEAHITQVEPKSLFGDGQNSIIIISLSETEDREKKEKVNDLK